MSTRPNAAKSAVDEPDLCYGREVFERLRNTMDFLVREGSDGRVTVVATTDDCIIPNYDIRDDGVYLKLYQELDSLDWLPACVAVGADAPDPLSAPALPLPFTARQFGAFVLGGWGWFLGQRFGMPYDDLNDEDAVLHLSGQRDAKPREVVLTARKLLALAREQVAKSDPTWENAKRNLVVAELTLSKHATPPAELRAALAAAQRAVEDAEPAWRKAMVRVLLPLHQAKAIKDASPQTAEQRQADRYRACVDAGLLMPSDDYVHLPRGINDVAMGLGITRQSLSADVKAHIRRMSGK
jgi:hypothetical protein